MMPMVRLMGILNLTPDSFWSPSRACASDAMSRIRRMLDDGASIVDIGAVSTRPGAQDVSLEEEWRRLMPVVSHLDGIPFSIDTTRAEIVRRVWESAGPFMVNDISSGEDDPEMLPLVGRLGLEYVAMHKRGGPGTMDAMTDYPGGVVNAVRRYFEDFALRAKENGIADWILDPGFGFAKTNNQNVELLESLSSLKMEGHPILVGVADKRFTAGNTEYYHAMAVRNGADILRVHDVAAAAKTIKNYA